MLKVLEERRDELQAQKSALWDEITAIKSKYTKDLTERQLRDSGLCELFARYEHIDAHLCLYSGAWADGIMLSDNRDTVFKWLRFAPEGMKLRPFIVAYDAALLDECHHAQKLLGLCD